MEKSERIEESPLLEGRSSADREAIPTQELVCKNLNPKKSMLSPSNLDGWVVVFPDDGQFILWEAKFKEDMMGKSLGFGSRDEMFLEVCPVDFVLEVFVIGMTGLDGAVPLVEILALANLILHWLGTFQHELSPKTQTLIKDPIW